MNFTTYVILQIVITLYQMLSFSIIKTIKQNKTRKNNLRQAKLKNISSLTETQ